MAGRHDATRKRPLGGGPGWRELLASSAYEDPDLAARAALVRIILVPCVVIGTACAIVYPFVFQEWLEALAVNGSFALTSLILLRLLHTRHVRAAIRATSVMGMVVVLVSILVSRGIRSPVVIAFPAAIMLVGFLESARAAVYATVICVAALLVVGVTGMYGIIPRTPLPYTELQLWLAFSASLAGTGVVVFASIRSLRSALQSVEEGRLRYANLVEHSPDGVLELDSDGVILSCNDAGAHMIGLEKELVEGTILWELPSLAETRPEAIQGYFRDSDVPPEADGIDMVFVSPDGARTYTRARRRSVKHASGTLGFQVALRDETRRVEAEKEKADLQSALIQTQKMQVVGQLAGGVAHDFNNYLTVIRTCTEALGSKLPSTGREAALLAAIADAGDKSSQLTRQLLAFSRKQVVQPVAVNLNHVVSRAEAMVRRLLDARIELEVREAPEPVVVEADPSQLEVALLNLVVNARDAMPEGGRLVIESGTMVVGEDLLPRLGRIEPGLVASISVSDTGVGMDEATLERACEPFFSTKGSSGTGLGLSTVYGITEQLGGSFLLESRPGEGTRATIYLGLTDAPLHAADSRPSTPPTHGGHERILLVEDQELLRQVAAGILRTQGYQVSEAETAERALELFEAELVGGRPFALVLSDVVLPGIDGFELARRIAARDPSTAIQLMSGYSEPRVRGGRFVEDLLQKPFTATALLRRVRRRLDSRPPPRHATQPVRG